MISNNYYIIFNFVDTPRNFIKLRGVSTKLNIIFFHHANFQEINYYIVGTDHPTSQATLPWSVLGRLTSNKGALVIFGF